MRIAAFLACLVPALWGATPGSPDSWIPARWTGGPLEIAWRARAKTLPAGAAEREAIDRWYDPATLNLLEGSPVNCLLVTWSAGGDAEVERRQRDLVGTYAAAAHLRGIAVLGLVYPGTQLSPAAAAAQGLDGLVFEGVIPPGFSGAGVAIAIGKDGASARSARSPILAVEGETPGAHNLADMGIVAAPSSEPWIQSNLWLVRSFGLERGGRPVWISYQPERGSAPEYARFVADGAAAGGRWIVALDDGLRAGLFRRDGAALATWDRISRTLRFAAEHAEWRGLAAFGGLGVIVDPKAEEPSEYLKLVARRQVPYRLIARPELNGGTLANLRAVLATELAPPTAAERSLLARFAEQGGIVVAGPSWGNPPKDQPYAETALGKGRVEVYRDPDPETIARDLKDLLSVQVSGMVAFNVPTVITYASGGTEGRPLVIQLVNYSDTPATDITIRVKGAFRAARLITPDGAPENLPVSASKDRTDITIPKLSLWGGVLLESAGQSN